MHMDRAEATRLLLDSFETDWSLEPQEKLIARLWALREHLVELNNKLYDLALSTSKITSAIEARLRYDIFPEIKLRLQEKEGFKAQEISLDALHSIIKTVALDRFRSGQYADAVQAAFKEINARIKRLVFGQVDKDLDGAPLMGKVFGGNNPVLKLADLSTLYGRNVQNGYLQIFQGAMIGIRNPNAHENLKIDPIEAVHLLSLASLLMIRLDGCMEASPSVPRDNPTADADAAH